MRKALAFFPWLRLNEELTIGDIRLLRYVKGHRAGWEHVDRADVNAIFMAYRNRPKDPVREGVLLEIGDWKSGMEMNSATHSRMWQAREILAFSALSQRELFSSVGTYVNSDAFTLIVQNFRSGQGHYFAYSTRRRDGQTSNTWTNTDFTFQRPLHVAEGYCLDIDKPLAETLLKLPADDPVLEAITEFNAANTDAGAVAAHVELVMAKSALEWLLAIDEKRDSLVKALIKHFPATSVASAKGPLKKKWLSVRAPRHGRLLEACAMDFCILRNTAAHGKRKVGSAPQVWQHAQHLAFISVVFPLLVKKVLAERGKFEPSERDLDRMGHVEDYLAVDPFNQDKHTRRFAWAEVDSKIRLHGLARALRNRT